MWCRFITFCVLVTLVLFVVLSCIYGRPVLHLFFHRCCGEDIENDQVIFENFGNNFLRERLVGAEMTETNNVTLYDAEEVESVLENIRDMLNVHDPKTRKFFENDEAGKEVTEVIAQAYDIELTETPERNSVTEDSIGYTSDDWIRTKGHLEKMD